MLSRACASASSPRMAATISGRLLPSTARRTPLWISCNLSITSSSQECGAASLIGEARFGDQNGERWNVAVPFDQRRCIRKTPRGLRKQPPHRLGDVIAMVVDKHLAPLE